MPRSPAQRALKRDHINRLRRELYQRNIPRVNAKQLALFRADPQREARLKLEYVVCRECGATLDILKAHNGHSHLASLHRLTDEQYLAKWPGAPLVSIAFRERKARGGRKPKTALRGRSRPNLKIRGHVDGRPLRKSQLAPLLALGFSYSEIGKRVNRFFTTIQDAVRRMGLRPATKEARQMLTECRAFLRGNPGAGVAELKDWLSEQMMLSKAQHLNGERFARFAALDLNPLLERKSGGRPRGMTEIAVKEAQQLEHYLLEWEQKHGTKKGGMVYAAAKVYGRTEESRKAVARGNKLLSRYRTFLKGQIGQKPKA